MLTCSFLQISLMIVEERERERGEKDTRDRQKRQTDGESSFLSLFKTAFNSSRNLQCKTFPFKRMELSGESVSELSVCGWFCLWALLVDRHKKKQGKRKVQTSPLIIQTSTLTLPSIIIRIH